MRVNMINTDQLPSLLCVSTNNNKVDNSHRPLDIHSLKNSMPFVYGVAIIFYRGVMIFLSWCS